MAGSRPRRFVSSLRDSRKFFALYPGLTPWANFMSPPERGLVLAVETARLWLTFSVGISQVTSYRWDASFLPSGRERRRAHARVALCRPYGTRGFLRALPRAYALG